MANRVTGSSVRILSTERPELHGQLATIVALRPVFGSGVFEYKLTLKNKDIGWLSAEDVNIVKYAKL